MTKEEQAANLIENMRWAGLTDRLDDIRDLLYINSAQQTAMIELMLTMGTPMVEDDRKARISQSMKGADRITQMMKKRNEKCQKYIRNLMAEYDAILRGGST